MHGVLQVLLLFMCMNGALGHLESAPPLRTPSTISHTRMSEVWVHVCTQSNHDSVFTKSSSACNLQVTIDKLDAAIGPASSSAAVTVDMEKEFLNLG